MAGIKIPGIYRKFGLLMEYRHVADWEALGKHFDQKVKTVKGWGQGNAAQPRDSLPSWHLDRFVSLITQILPDSTGPDRIKDIVYGPASLLEQALRAHSPAAVEQFLKDEADRERIRLVRRPSQPGLIEVEGDGLDRPDLFVSLKEFFRLECDAPFPVQHVIALQQVHRLWGFVAADIDPSRRRILLPGIKDDGSPAFMRDSTHAGLHRIIVLQTEKPIPVPIETPDQAAIVIDYATLAGIIASYRAEPEAARHLYLLELMIGEADDAD